MGVVSIFLHLQIEFSLLFFIAVYWIESRTSKFPTLGVNSKYSQGMWIIQAITHFAAQFNVLECIHSNNKRMM